MIELFSRRQTDYFKRIGIHSLPGHFRKMEKELAASVNGAEPNGPHRRPTCRGRASACSATLCFRDLVVQRSRAYVRQSQLQQGGEPAIFPDREDPKVADYSVKKTYGRLLDMVEHAFAKEKPLFSLAIYYPLAYYKGDDTTIDPFAENRQKQVVGLIRTQFLKRFESSAHAFECSCDRLLVKLLAFVDQAQHRRPERSGRLERWKQPARGTHRLRAGAQRELFATTKTTEEADEDIVAEEMLGKRRGLASRRVRRSRNAAETCVTWTRSPSSLTS